MDLDIKADHLCSVGMWKAMMGCIIIKTLDKRINELFDWIQ